VAITWQCYYRNQLLRIALRVRRRGGRHFAVFNSVVLQPVTAPVSHADTGAVTGCSHVYLSHGNAGV